MSIQYYNFSSNLDESMVGVKAANLSKLYQLHLNVPPAICLPVCHDILFSAEELENLPVLVEKLVPSTTGWAVRSSSTLEDAHEKSWAGQFKTVIVAKISELIAAVKEVRASANIVVSGGGMGIIIQQFIEPDYAGVVFSCNPVTGEHAPIIELCQGRGEQLVSGQVTPATYGRAGWVNGELAGCDEAILKEIQRTACDLSKKWDFPVDMEWAVKDGTLYWLQVRPVTSSQPRSYEQFLREAAQLKGNWFLMDQCDQPFAPLIETLDPSGFCTKSFWKMQFVFHYPYIEMQPNIAGQAPKKFKEIWAEWKSMEEEYQPLFEEALARDLTTFSNQALWAELQKRIGNNRIFVDKYLDREWFCYRRNVTGKLQGYLKKTCNNPSEMYVTFLSLISQLGSTTWHKQAKLREMVDIVQKNPQVLPEIIKLIDNLEKNRAENSVENPTVNSNENLAVHPVKNTADNRTKCFMKKLAINTEADLSTGLSTCLANYLAEYGYEAANPMYYHLPTLAEKPEMLLDIIKNLANTHKIENHLDMEIGTELMDTPHKPRQALAHDTWRREALQISAKLPMTERLDFYRQMLILRKLLLRTENDDYILQKGMAQVRAVLIEMGNRLLPGNPEDIFYLTKDELETAVLAGTKASWAENILQRKAEFLKAKQINPPQKILDGQPHYDTQLQATGDVLRGNPVSAGIAEGYIYIVKDPLNPETFTDIPQNSIVVSRLLTPALAGNVLGAKAFIIEEGSLLSHGAILAREMQIPAVIGVEAASLKLVTGQYVTVDAYTGQITL